MVSRSIACPDPGRINVLRDVSPSELSHHFNFGFTDASIKCRGSANPVTMVGPVVLEFDVFPLPKASTDLELE